MPPIAITDPTKDVAKINSAFQQLDVLYTQLAALKKQVNYHAGLLQNQTKIAEPTGVNNVVFQWVGTGASTGTLSWNNSSTLDRNGRYVPITSGQHTGLASDTTYWLAWNPVHNVMAFSTSVDVIHQFPGNLMICSVVTGTDSASLANIGGGGTESGGSGFNRTIYSSPAGSSGIVTLNPGANTGPTVTLAAGTSGTDVNVASPSANQIDVNIPTADATHTGKLAAADWSTFNAKSKVDGIAGAVTLVAGSNITITDNSPSAGDITIAATGSGGSGSLVLLEQHTASTSASLDFTTWYSATYDEYVIEIVNLVFSGTGIQFGFKVSTDGGSTWKAANYAVSLNYAQGGTTVTQASTSVTALYLLTTTGTISANGSLNGSVRLFNPGGANYTDMGGNFRWLGASGLLSLTWSGEYAQTTAVNAFQFLPSSGTITSGTIRCYGIAKV